MIDWAGVARDVREGRPGPEDDLLCGTCARFRELDELWSDASHHLTVMVGTCDATGRLTGCFEDACERWEEHR